jgi:hypothetical protein
MGLVIPSGSASFAKELLVLFLLIPTTSDVPPDDNDDDDDDDDSDDDGDDDADESFPETPVSGFVSLEAPDTDVSDIPPGAGMDIS